MHGNRRAIACSSGQAALQLAIDCLVTERTGKRRVVLPSYTCEALIHAVCQAGARPVIVDVDNDGNIDPEVVKANLGQCTLAVIVPHMFGKPAQLGSILKYTSAMHVDVIEDCAMAVGARFRNKLVGLHGIISVFSFYATKVLCTGEGGMVTSGDDILMDRVNESKCCNGRMGRYNYKMTDLEAALGLCQLRKIEGFIEKRRRIAALYETMLGGVVVTPNLKGSIAYRYVVGIPDGKRDRLREALRKEGIECGLGVKTPLHRLFPEYCESSCPTADRLWMQNLSLPIYPTLRTGQVARIARTLTAELRRV